MQEKTEYQESLYKELQLVNDNFARVKKNEITDVQEAQGNGQHLADDEEEY